MGTETPFQKSRDGPVIIYIYNTVLPIINKEIAYSAVQINWDTCELRRHFGADSENLDFVAPPEEHRFYGIFCFFGSPASILKTLPLSKCVQKTL